MKNLPPHRLALYYRAPAPDEARRSQDHIFERLSELERMNGTHVDLHEWPMRVGLDTDEDERAREALSHYAEFDSWAHDHNVSLAPYFNVHESHWFTGEDTSELIFPMLCLAVYDGDELVDVFPHTEGDHAVSISEFIDRLEADLDRDESAQPHQPAT
ncbi:HTH domain-containing protein [Haladaptatus sp. DJG-WS-42]|uniref:HTH domain-containing protein n=1 Tax=Haladaptatus sp. DJG-WS-42 TaxID=3120516 RepID=UPI0030CE5F4C